jgi:glyoxylase-like metal-dependent hydrolase (beta-lactamase superfamily II)
MPCPDILLKNGDRIDTLTCIHLPGHAPGSIRLLETGTKTLFAGDAIRSDRISLSEGPRGFTIDLPRSRDSLHIIAGLEFETLLVGYGNPLRPEASARVRDLPGGFPCCSKPGIQLTVPDVPD